MTTKLTIYEQVAIKLAIENGGDGIMKRFQLPQTGTFKYLQRQAVRYAFAIDDSVEFDLNEYNVRLYFNDLDGDAILIDCGKDLRDAMKSYLNKKALKVVARVERVNQKSTTSATTQTSKPTSPVEPTSAVEGLVGLVAALTIALSKQVVKVSEDIVTDLNSKKSATTGDTFFSTDTSGNVPVTEAKAAVFAPSGDEEKATSNNDNNKEVNIKDEAHMMDEKAEQEKIVATVDIKNDEKGEASLPDVSVKMSPASFSIKHIRKVVKSAPVKAAIAPFKAAVMAQMNATKTDQASASTGEKPETSVANNATVDTDKMATGNSDSAASGANVPEAKVDSPKEDFPFIHGRHTCDKCLTTPIIGKRYHAVHLSDYDMCQNCYDSADKSNLQEFEVAELDRDRVFQEKWRRRYAQFTCQDQDASRCRRGQPAHPHGPNRRHNGHRGHHPFGPPPFHGPHHHGPYSVGPPPFHGPHPHGPHPHGPSPFPQPFPAGHRRHGVFPHPPPPHGYFFGFPHTFSQQTTDNERDTDLLEAIKISLEDAKKKFNKTDATETSSLNSEAQVGTNTNSAGTAVKPNGDNFSFTKSSTEQDSDDKSHTKPAHDQQFVVEPEIIVSPTKFENSSSNSKSSEPRNTSYAHDADGSAAVVLGQTLDMIADAIDAFNIELHRESGKDSNPEAKDTTSIGHTSEMKVDALVSSKDKEEEINQTEVEDVSVTSHAEFADYQSLDTDSESAMDECNNNGVTIVDGTTAENDDDSRSSWSVVEDYLRSPTDEDLARAAQAIGSALFSSDMARSRSENGNNFDGSTISSVPTVTHSLGNGSNVSLSQFDRWALQLNQLHELGFANDALMIDIMERLNAANLGSNLDEEVTVAQVVNALMKDM